MALTVEDGTGLAAADSYVTEAATDTYWADRGSPAAWSGATTAQKETSLREVAQYLDGEYGARFVGKRNSRAQGLEWPRTGGSDRSGYAVPNDEVPKEVQLAAFELALRSRSGSLLPDRTADESGISNLSQEMDVFKESVTYTSGSGPSQAKYRVVDDILAPILTGGRGELRTQRG